MSANLVLLIVFFVPLVGVLGLICWAEPWKPRRSIPEIVEATIQSRMPELIAPLIEQVVREEYAANPLFRFLKWMQWELQRVDPKLTGEQSFQMAKQALREWRIDHKAKFRADGFDWTEQGAKDLIHSYEIEYWDGAA